LRARGLGGGGRSAPGRRRGVFCEVPRGGPDWSEALADPAIDAVAIATPAEQHAEWSRRRSRRQACLRGKPLALHHAEGARLVGEAEKRSLVLMVGHLLQYHAAFIKMRALVREAPWADCAMSISIA